MEEYSVNEIEYEDITDPEGDERLLKDLDKKHPLNKSEQSALYSVRMGFVRIRDLIEALRSPQVCLEGCRLQPEDYRFVPDKVKALFPEDVRRELETAYVKAEDVRKRTEDKARDDERYYRDSTGDYNHDGRVDGKDKRLERNGEQYLGI